MIDGIPNRPLYFHENDIIAIEVILETIGLRDPTFSCIMYIPFLTGHYASFIVITLAQDARKAARRPCSVFHCVLLFWGVNNWLSAVVCLFCLPWISHFILPRLVVSDKPLHQFWAILVLSTCWRYRGRWGSSRVRGSLGASWHSSAKRKGDAYIRHISEQQLRRSLRCSGDPSRWSAATSLHVKDLVSEPIRRRRGYLSTSLSRNRSPWNCLQKRSQCSLLSMCGLFGLVL